MHTRNLLSLALCALVLLSFSTACVSQDLAVFNAPGTYSKLNLGDTTKVEDQGENLNGILPNRVYIKTRTQTFNSYAQFAIVSGRIYEKSLTDDSSGWKLLLGTGLPQSKDFATPRSVLEISADADQIVALADNGLFYYLLFESSPGSEAMRWYDKHGWPNKTTLALNDQVRGNRAWSFSKRKSQVMWYEDRFGNQHHWGVIGLESYYFLDRTGQGIRFNDNGLPTDYSHELLGPERGAFIAASLSVSASTMFVIDMAGTMYTRLADFDTIGSDPMLFRYTYAKTPSAYPGWDWRSSHTQWGLPAEDWRKQPSIPLAGAAALTSRITIVQNGQGNAARELRVAGKNAQGETGYYYKQIFDDEWRFAAAPLSLRDTDYLPPAPTPAELRGAPLEAAYYGRITLDGREIKLTIPDFSICEQSCHLELSRGGETVTVTLHPVEAWTYFPRYDPGRDGTPKLFFMTVDIPTGAFDAVSPEYRAILEKALGELNLATMASVAEATTDYIHWEIPASGGGKTTAFLTIDPSMGRDVSPSFIREIGLLKNSLIGQCDDPSLVLSADKPIDIARRSEIEDLVRRNVALRAAMTAELKTLSDYAWSSTRSRWTFSALDTLSSVTLIKHLNPLSISDLLNQGDRLTRMNQQTYGRIAQTRRDYYGLVIEIIDLRIAAYNDLLRDFDRGLLASALPAEYAENFGGYFSRIGLDASLSGRGNLGDEKSAAQLSLFSPHYPFFALELGDGETGELFAVSLDNAATQIRERNRPPSETSPIIFHGKIRLVSSSGPPDRQARAQALDGEPILLEMTGSQLSIRLKSRHSDAPIFESK